MSNPLDPDDESYATQHRTDVARVFADAYPDLGPDPHAKHERAEQRLRDAAARAIESNSSIVFNPDECHTYDRYRICDDPGAHTKPYSAWDVFREPVTNEEYADGGAEADVPAIRAGSNGSYTEIALSDLDVHHVGVPPRVGRNTSEVKLSAEQVEKLADAFYAEQTGGKVRRGSLWSVDWLRLTKRVLDVAGINYEGRMLRG